MDLVEGGSIWRGGGREGEALSGLPAGSRHPLPTPERDAGAGAAGPAKEVWGRALSPGNYLCPKPSMVPITLALITQLLPSLQTPTCLAPDHFSDFTSSHHSLSLPPFKVTPASGPSHLLCPLPGKLLIATASIRVARQLSPSQDFST